MSRMYDKIDFKRYNYNENDKIDFKRYIYYTIHFIVQFSCYFILREKIRRIQYTMDNKIQHNMYTMDNKKYNLLIHPVVYVILHISLAIFMYIIIELLS